MSINPELLKDLMLDEITKESKVAGYTEAKSEVEQKLASGTALKDTRSILTLEEEQNISTVYTLKQGKGGFLIVTMPVSPQEDRELYEQFRSSFRVL